MLTPQSHQSLPTSKGSNKLILFDCSCGRKGILKVWRNYVTGHETSCGECDILTKEHLRDTPYGDLQMKELKEFHKNSNTRVTWMCRCGRETDAMICNVTNKKIKSCGKCTMLSAHHFETTQYGKLKMTYPIDVHPHSEKIVSWDCECGNKTLTKICYVTGKDTKSCGRCNIKDTEH